MTLQSLKRTSLAIASALLLVLPVWSGMQYGNNTSTNQSSTQQNTQANDANSTYDNGQSDRTATSPNGQTSNDNGVTGQTATGTETTPPARSKTTKKHRRHHTTNKSAASSESTAGASTSGTATSPQNQSEVVIPAGTRLVVRMADSVNSDTNRVGDQFRGTLDEDVIANGMTVAPKGSNVYGRLVRAGAPQSGFNAYGPSGIVAQSLARSSVGQTSARMDQVGTSSNTAAASNPNNPALGSGNTSLSTNSSAQGTGSLTTNNPGALGTTDENSGLAATNGMNQSTSGAGNTTGTSTTGNTGVAGLGNATSTPYGDSTSGHVTTTTPRTIMPGTLAPSTSSSANPNESAANASGNAYNLPPSEGGQGTTTTSGLSQGTMAANQPNPNLQGTGAAANGPVPNTSDQDLTLVLTAIEINGQRYSLAGIDQTTLSTTREGAGGTTETAGITDTSLDRGAPVTAVIASAGGGMGVGAGVGSGAAGSQVQVQGNHIVVPAQSVLEFRTQTPVTIGANSVNR